VELPGSSFGFSSSLAKRYHFKWIFPNRSQTAPSSLRELITKVVSNMSSTVLKNSTVLGDFPNDDGHQHVQTLIFIIYVMSKYKYFTNCQATHLDVSEDDQLSFIYGNSLLYLLSEFSSAS
jgi:hypothetical protein